MTQATRATPSPTSFVRPRRSSPASPAPRRPGRVEVDGLARAGGEPPVRSIGVNSTRMLPIGSSRPARPAPGSSAGDPEPGTASARDHRTARGRVGETPVARPGEDAGMRRASREPRDRRRAASGWSAEAARLARRHRVGGRREPGVCARPVCAHPDARAPMRASTRRPRRDAERAARVTPARPRHTHRALPHVAPGPRPLLARFARAPRPLFARVAPARGAPSNAAHRPRGRASAHETRLASRLLEPFVTPIVRSPDPALLIDLPSPTSSIRLRSGHEEESPQVPRASDR